ncbi:tRNA (guanosine(37)-N1)-methyltransferase TrmD [Nonomuraea aurantiaca]|uniref:tRNA (guanosine(37)-N1)-methyltransferase TrmD n=1 Tax=Nonomuraea aurantiaca TaxID=2878562 RepID=UPI001CD9AE58|nr:tRNA (guanosine(37)-N1)-methyltransferase TrmD [Nonomuraea aurantiaca]MCA2221399.1 tRNA (guanosine(37)-N1)-methyltransferase TrmD [Nonomuraea aurantiaca]
MRLDIISIFPEYFAPLDVSLIGKARERGTLDARVHQLRDWAHDVHKTVDDTPYGGGPGMVMKPEVWGEAIDAVIEGGSPTGVTGGGSPRLIVPTPSGRPFTQELAQELAAEPWLLFACGRYEGIDSRVMAEYGTRLRVDEISIGDYVLAGGEVATLVMVEAIGRLLPGVLGNAHSAVDDSFAPGAMRNLVEGPVFTKPPVWRGHEVPPVLLSGHHGKVARWRRDEALRRTVANRPELAAALDPETLDKHDRRLLEELSFRFQPEDMAN